ncbi:tetraspanin-31-like isoform X1 [Mizuhopecten yessoensis]|uniref:tetraspanin-31-like isoform X1 n=1 Tax=Mizuhopecten yessoensis TaxID=6573 RepID=UPI000B45E813|nr:tetraspanin-31-like isoform X1 [Mizuhopecten yessoensis]
MVCGGFQCSKNALAALNVLYIFVSFILIGVAAYGRVVAIVTNLTLVGGIIACGVFLFIIALIGLIGAIKHHQVLLFFYMIILFLLFLLQFSLACACLAINEDQQEQFAENGWRLASNQTKETVQYKFDCCGFKDWSIQGDNPSGHPPCGGIQCCSGGNAGPCCTKTSNITEADLQAMCPCQTCLTALQNEIHSAFKITGGVGLFFSFTEIIGVWLALRYRNQKDPKANPSAFL